MEGGNVSRLNKIVNFSIFSQSFFGKLFKSNKKLFLIYYKIYIDTVSTILKDCGININTVPNLDQIRKKSHSIIGTRSFSSNPNEISQLGKFCINFYNKNKIGTVIKHIQAHGLSKYDTHKKLSIVNQNIKLLNKIDFFPFKNQKSYLSMTAHIIYKSIDSKNTATHSQKVIGLIRKTIGYKNLIMSDDISMKSLKYSTKKNTTQAFKAGCNLVLHCNGKYNEMLIVAENSPLLSKFVIKKTSQLLNIIR